MPALELKAYVELLPDCRLRYDCPLMSGESFEADRFFAAHQGKFARFVGFATEYVGFGDYLGRPPGLYVNPDGLQVVFEGETEVRRLNRYHFMVADASNARIMVPDFNPKTQRVGDLPEPIRFLPLDLVCLASDLIRTERRVKSVGVDDTTGAVSYKVLAAAQERQQFEESEKGKSKARTGFLGFKPDTPPPIEMVPRLSSDLCLIKKGPLSLLMEGETSVETIESVLEDPVDALTFWTKYGRGPKLDKKYRPQTLSEALALVAEGKVVFIDDHNGMLREGSRQLIDLYEVNEVARAFRSHIAGLSRSFWEQKAREQEKRATRA